MLKTPVLLLSLILAWPHSAFSADSRKVNLDLEIQKGPGERFFKADMSDDDFVGMYQKWFDTGLSSLMSAVANKKLKRQRRSVVRQFGECSSDATNIPKHAQCLKKLLDDEIKEDPKDKVKKGERLNKYRNNVPDKTWTGGFKTVRTKRAPRIVQSTNQYNLNSHRKSMTPLGSIAKLLVESIKEMKNKTELPPWQDTVLKLKDNGAKLQKYKKMIEDDSEESMDQMALRSVKEKMLGGQRTAPDVDIQGLIDDPDKLNKFIAEKKKKKEKPEERIVSLIRQAMKLGYTLAGQNTTNFDNKTMKLISPRFLGILPESNNEDEVSLVSPSLFSLHNDGEGLEKLTSLPNLLKGAGLEDQQLWLDAIMEAAGVNEQSEKIEDEVHDYEFNTTRNLFTNVSSLIDENGTPMYATKQNLTDLGGDLEHVEIFEKLHQSYSKNQIREMNTTGYAILNKKQIELLYGPSSPLNNSHAMEKFMNLTEDQIHERMHENIKAIAQMEKFELRKKDIVLSPVVAANAVLAPALASQPFILSPILFTPLVLSPSIYGAVILSPWLFVPLVLSPRVLGALILSPFLFSPIILTPLALHPAILSPGLFNPFVLSPLVLVPLILTPQVFTPLILNPLCLAPIILNPMLGSPLVLSPFVLSPIIASPMILSALVLSPYALSPVIWSPLVAFAVVLSPSWLS